MKCITLLMMCRRSSRSKYSISFSLHMQTCFPNTPLLFFSFVCNSFEYNTRFEQAKGSSTTTTTTTTTKKHRFSLKSTTSTKTSATKTSIEGKSPYKVHGSLCFEVLDPSSAEYAQLQRIDEETKEAHSHPLAALSTPVHDGKARSQSHAPPVILSSPGFEEDNDYSNIDYHMMPSEKQSSLHHKSSRVKHYSPLDTPESHRDKAAKREHIASSAAAPYRAPQSGPGTEAPSSSSSSSSRAHRIP